MPRTPVRIAAAPALLSLVAGVPFAAAAQGTLLDLPASFVTPNFDHVFIGVAEAHEAGAYLARTSGPAAAWYNPGGLAGADRTAVSINVRGLDLGIVSLGDPFPDSVQVSAFGILPLFASLVLGPDITGWKDVRIAISGTEQIASDALAWWGSTDASGHWTYASDAGITSGVLAVSLAWAASPRLRIGGSLGGSWTRLYENDHFSAVDGAAASSSQRTRLLSGMAFHFIPAAGVQWEPLEGFAVGAVARSPGVKFWGRATVQGERQDTAAASSTNASLQTDDAAFDFRYPLDLEAGVALRRPGWELELNLRYHASTGSYTLVSSDVPVQTVTAPGGSTVTSPFAPVTYDGRAVLDLSLGGSVALGRTLRLHAGGYALPSPVASGNPWYRRTDLYGVRAGLSFEAERLSGSVGLGYEAGRSSGSPTLAGVAADGSVLVQQLSLAFAAEFRR
jgi:hypothetical protein